MFKERSNKQAVPQVPTNKQTDRKYKLAVPQVPPNKMLATQMLSSRQAGEDRQKGWQS